MQKHHFLRLQGYPAKHRGLAKVSSGRNLGGDPSGRIRAPGRQTWGCCRNKKKTAYNHQLEGINKILTCVLKSQKAGVSDLLSGFFFVDSLQWINPRQR